jgi:predicted ATP-dependent endonuclease of OLD family
MSLDTIGLENFRGFSKASIALKPLTVLLGANSSGKSSFGNAMAAMAHAHYLYGSSSQANLTPMSAGAKETVKLPAVDRIYTITEGQGITSALCDGKPCAMEAPAAKASKP